MSQPGIKLNQFQDIDGHPIKLIHKKDNREVFVDGNYVIKKTAPDAFNFPVYEKFQKENPCFVKVHSFDDGVIIMDKVEGIMFQQWAKTTTVDNLWHVCFTHRLELYKSYFDFFGRRDIHANDKLFLHNDGVPGNVIIDSNNNPTYVDPDGTIQLQWDMFLQKINEHQLVWQNDYNFFAHRNPALQMEKWNKSLSELGYKQQYGTKVYS